MKHDGRRYWYFRNKITDKVLEDADGDTIYWSMDEYSESEMLEEGYMYDIDLEDPDEVWKLDVYRDF